MRGLSNACLVGLVVSWRIMKDLRMKSLGTVDANFDWIHDAKFFQSRNFMLLQKKRIHLN